MVHLIDVNEHNRNTFFRLTSADGERAADLAALAYLRGSQNVRIAGIACGDRLIGAALLADEETYLLIDCEARGTDLSAEALRRVLCALRDERGLSQATVRVLGDDALVRRVPDKADLFAGCEATSVGPNALLFRFEQAHTITDQLITDHTDPAFQEAFRQYFAEFGIRISDWDGLFREMNAPGDVETLLRVHQDGRIVGFIMIQPEQFSSRFFQETCGFIREFWVAEPFRRQGHGSSLLRLAEARFFNRGIHTSILTTDSAEDYYQRRGYVRVPACQAKNHDPVLIKRLSRDGSAFPKRKENETC